MRTSIQDVANLAQVSTMTVSRVLRSQSSSVRDATRQRVLKAVAELSYIPVQSALQNRHVQTNVLGLVPYYLSASRHELDGLTYDGMLTACYEHDYDLLTMLRSEKDWQANMQHARFLDRRCDGFVFISTASAEWQAVLEILATMDVRAVVCYRRDVPDGIAWVDVDNEAIASIGVDCLAHHGHRRVGYVAGPASQQENREPRLSTRQAQRAYDDLRREQLLVEECSRRSHPTMQCQALHCVTPDHRLDPTVLTEILERRITGVVCVNDNIAIQLMTLARNAGVSVPKDLSIIGIDGLKASEDNNLTTIAFGYDTIGRLAVESFRNMWNGMSAVEASRIVPVNLIERGTVAAAPQKRHRLGALES